MSVVTCQLYKVAFKKELTAKVVKKLVAWGKFEPIDATAPVSAQVDDDYFKDLKNRKGLYLDTIEQIESNFPKTVKTEVDSKTVEKAFNRSLNQQKSLEKQLKKLVESVEILKKEKERFSAFVEKKTELKNLATLLPDWEFPVFSSFELVTSRLLLVPEQSVADFNKASDQITDLIFIPLEKRQEDTLFLAIIPKEKLQEYETLIKQFEGREMTPDPLLEEYAVREILEKISKKENALEKKLKEAEKEVLSLYKQDSLSFKCFIDILSYELQALAINRFLSFYTGDIRDKKIKESSIINSGEMYQIEGWVEPADEAELVELMKSIDKSIMVFPEDDLLADEQVRTVLLNNTLVKPFEAITKLMGVPSTREIDPTPYLSPFFVLFFGFALGDGGYGFIMSAVALYLLFKKDLANEFKQGALLLFYCGLSTILFGALTGSWFGLEIMTWDNRLGALLQSLKIVDLQSSLVFVLAGSIFIGFVHQLIGLVLQAVVYFKNNQRLNALTGPGTWIFLLLAMSFRAATGMFEGLEYALDVSNWILIASAISFIIGQGIKTRPVYLIPVVGIAQFFNITSFLSNSLSYARLLALGLATSVIAEVINLLAGIFGSADNIFGILIIGLIMVLGHSINIALNMLGTFINVLRLQLVEFFPRFFYAQGVELNPARLTSGFFNYSKNLLNTYAGKPS